MKILPLVHDARYLDVDHEVMDTSSAAIYLTT